MRHPGAESPGQASATANVACQGWRVLWVCSPFDTEQTFDRGRCPALKRSGLVDGARMPAVPMSLRDEGACCSSNDGLSIAGGSEAGSVNDVVHD